jgi:hypothetical protein
MIKFDLLRIGQWFYYERILYKKITYDNGKKVNAERIDTGVQVIIPLTAGVTIWTPWIIQDELN